MSATDVANVTSAAGFDGCKLYQEHSLIKVRMQPIKPPKVKANVVEPPKASDKYMACANQDFTLSDRPRPVLVVLDLNGALLHRYDKMQCDLRPHMDKLLALLDSDHVKLMVWSSAWFRNVDQLVNVIMKPEQRQQLVAVWSREQLPIPEPLKHQAIVTYKELGLIWDNDDIQACHPTAGSWDQTNTILVDDSTDKATSEPFNVALMPTFNGVVGSALATAAFVEFDRTVESGPDETLAELARYINLASRADNVSSFMRQHPFERPGWKTVEAA